MARQSYDRLSICDQLLPTRYPIIYVRAWRPHDKEIHNAALQSRAKASGALTARVVNVDNLNGAKAYEPSLIEIKSSEVLSMIGIRA